MTGVFVQWNEESMHRNSKPTGWVICENGCWEWVGFVSKTGYAYTSRNRKKVIAHREVYEKFRGPIPEGMTIDHKCRKRDCVNPDHLEVVTQGENVLRGNAPTAHNARKTHCPKGHEYTSENTAIYGHSRRCRSCYRTSSNLRYHNRSR